LTSPSPLIDSKVISTNKEEIPTYYVKVKQKEQRQVKVNFIDELSAISDEQMINIYMRLISGYLRNEETKDCMIMVLLHFFMIGNEARLFLLPFINELLKGEDNISDTLKTLILSNMMGISIDRSFFTGESLNLDKKHALVRINFLEHSISNSKNVKEAGSYLTELLLWFKTCPKYAEDKLDYYKAYNYLCLIDDCNKKRFRNINNKVRDKVIKPSNNSYLC